MFREQGWCRLASGIEVERQLVVETRGSSGATEWVHHDLCKYILSSLLSEECRLFGNRSSSILQAQANCFTRQLLIGPLQVYRQLSSSLDPFELIDRKHILLSWTNPTCFWFKDQFRHANKRLSCHVMKDIYRYPISKHASIDHAGKCFRNETGCLWVREEWFWGGGTCIHNLCLSKALKRCT